jgi:hypothetical protein
MRLDTAGIVAHLDAEIGRLQQAKALLLGGDTAAPKAKRGRPKGSVTKPALAPKTARKGKRTLSPEGRKAIADAMKRRWAERKKQA